jgi:hypothetical protein
MKCWIRILIALVSLSACGELDTVQEGTTSFYFAAPQPAGNVNVTEFKAPFLGRYRSAKDSTLTLLVTAKEIHTEYAMVFFVTQNDIDNNADLFVADGMLHGFKEDQPLRYEQQQDTFYAIFPKRTALFVMDSDEVLGQVDDAYLLNYLESDGLWSTILLRKDAGQQLIMESIDHDPVLKKILKMDDVEKKKLDPFLTYIARPTAKELAELIDAKAFTDSEVYLPIAH